MQNICLLDRSHIPDFRSCCGAQVAHYGKRHVTGIVPTSAGSAAQVCHRKFEATDLTRPLIFVAKAVREDQTIWFSPDFEWRVALASSVHVQTYAEQRATLNPKNSVYEISACANVSPVVGRCGRQTHGFGDLNSRKRHEHQPRRGQPERVLQGLLHRSFDEDALWLYLGCRTGTKSETEHE